MRLSKARVIAVLSLLSAVALAAPPGPSAGVIERPTRASGQLPGPLGYSARHIDLGISPRKDFYRYAAGNGLEQLTIPDAEADIGAMSMLGANVDQQLLQLAVKASQGGAPNCSAGQQVGDHDRAAMDTRRRDALGLNDFNLNISRYVSTAVGEAEIDLDAVHAELVDVERAIAEAKQRHNGFLKELGLKPLP